MNSIEDIKRKSIQKKTNKELSTITIITVIDAQFTKFSTFFDF
tara:strand:- start:404 stop:532 length:129 start_codon:yes stop_codon:yes gene_type:complete